MKILVIRLSSLGDVVLTVPVFSALRKQYPDAHLAVAVKAAYADVFSGNSDINETVVLGAEESLLAFIRRIQTAHFDVVVDLHANLRSRLISAFSHAPRRLRYQKAALARRLFVGWRWSSQALQAHTLERYLNTLEPLGIVTPPAAPRSVLVIQTAFLGDAVLTTPLLEALHIRFPAASLTVLCTPEIADVFGSQAAVSHVLVFDKRGNERSWFRRIAFALSLRRHGFELALLPHRSFTSAFLAWAAGIPRRIGFSRGEGRWGLTDVVPFEWGVHDVDRNIALLKPLGGSVSPIPLTMQPEMAAEQKMLTRLAQAGVETQDRLLGINPGSVWATKRWLPERFAAVADRIAGELGFKVIFVGGKKDAVIVQQVMDAMKGPALNWAGTTSLKELIALIARCQLFLTNDSGPMHIAVACQVPTVAIFGPTTRQLGFFPYGKGHTVIEKDLACRPCGLHGHDQCPLGHFDCMKQITVSEVFDALKATLTPAPLPEGEGGRRPGACATRPQGL